MDFGQLLGLIHRLVTTEFKTTPGQVNFTGILLGAFLIHRLQPYGDADVAGLIVLFFVFVLVCAVIVYLTQES